MGSNPIVNPNPKSHGTFHVPDIILGVFHPGTMSLDTGYNREPSSWSVKVETLHGSPLKTKD